MPVAVGSTLAHFEITAKLGRGGMGEVFRARDKELDREVAIKVYYSAKGEITAVAVDWSPGVPSFGEPQPLFSVRLRVEKTEFDVYPDGQTFLLNELIPDTDELPMLLVQGWDSVLPD